MLRAPVFAAAVLLLVTGSGFDAQAATVTGKVTGAPPPPLSKHSGYGKYRRGEAPAGKTPHPLIVIFNPDPPGKVPAPPAKHPVMDQRNEQFSPRALPVMVGGTVDFLNSDNFYHNVFSLSSPKKFDLGRYRQGNSRPVTFSKPGLVKLFCDIHPDMIGYILVTETPWYASASVSGDFTIEDVPPGRYSVSVWHEALSEPQAIKSVTVGPEASVTVDVSLEAGPEP